MRAGGCQCGEIRYEVTAEPIGLYVCHCRECQNQSASAFGISLRIPRDGFRITRGSPRSWKRPTDSGRTMVCSFCPTCGSRIWHELEGGAKVISLKGGSLDQPVDISKATHIWVSRKIPGIEIPPTAKQFPEQD
jgi:hypothetical protein